MFEAMEMEGFAERARAELLATGERARKRSVQTQCALTPREAQIVRLTVFALASSSYMRPSAAGRRPGPV
jgi:hypothetical protein